jgi:hypothetical protein
MDEAFFADRHMVQLFLDAHDLRLAQNPRARSVLVAGPDQLLGPGAEPAWEPPEHLISRCNVYWLTEIVVSIISYELHVSLRSGLCFMHGQVNAQHCHM